MRKELTQDSSLVSFSVDVYRMLLAAYPSGFGRAYSPHMLQVFRDNCRRTIQQGGTSGMLELWALTMLDYISTVIEENLQRGTEMSKSKFIKISGWSMTIGAIAFVLGFIAGTRPEYSPYNARSLAIDRYLNDADMILFFLGMLLVVIGLVGLYVGYGERSGWFGKISLAVSIVSGLVTIVGATGLGIYDSDPYWYMFFYGMTIMLLGLVFFGIACLRNQALPRWNWLPLAAGIWWPLFVIVSSILESSKGGWLELPDAFFMILISLTGLGLAGLGYVLQSDAPEEQQALPVT